MSGAESGMHVIVSGRVQGVGFRAFAVRTARALGLRGMVRNLPDGRVETRAVGPESRLAAFRDALREGPPAARVSDLAISPCAPETVSETGFHER